MARHICSKQQETKTVRWRCISLPLPPPPPPFSVSLSLPHIDTWCTHSCTHIHIHVALTHCKLYYDVQMCVRVCSCRDGGWRVRKRERILFIDIDCWFFYNDGTDVSKTNRHFYTHVYLWTMMIDLMWYVFSFLYKQYQSKAVTSVFLMGSLVFCEACDSFLHRSGTTFWRLTSAWNERVWAIWLAAWTAVVCTTSVWLCVDVTSDQCCLLSSMPTNLSPFRYEVSFALGLLHAEFSSNRHWQGSQSLWRGSLHLKWQ